jgi:hypothetical protein
MAEYFRELEEFTKQEEKRRRLERPIKQKVTGVLTNPCFLEVCPSWNERYTLGIPAGSRITVICGEEELLGFELQEDKEEVTQGLITGCGEAKFRRGGK